MTNLPGRSRLSRQHNKRTKFSLLLSQIAPQLVINDLGPDVIARISKYAHDLTRLEKKQIASKEEFIDTLMENRSSNPESETKEWISRHVIMNALTNDDIKDDKLICFSSLPVQFLFASNYLKETYENGESKNPLFFNEIIDDGTRYPGDELLFYLIELLEEKHVNDLMVSFFNMLDDKKKQYYLALGSRILRRCVYPNEKWWKNLDEKINELSVMPDSERNEKMIDPASLPILMKILDFLFGEGSKILQERRERRMAQDISKTENLSSPSVKTNTPEESGSELTVTINSKDSALSEKIEKAAWLLVAGKVEEKLSLLDINQKNLSLAKEQYAKWGGALVPQVIIHNLEEAENNAITLIVELQEILGKVYGKKIVLPYLE